MARYDEILIDPGPEALLAALAEATKAANGRLRARRVVKTGASWRRMLRRNRGLPQGLRTYRGASQVGAAFVRVAWWQDYVGRKHWRIVGDRTDYAFFWTYSSHPSNRSPFAREPLWHIYPEGLALRETPAGREVVAVCACGAGGTLGALGWAGPSCGPCHDRREEGLPPLPRAGNGCTLKLPHTPYRCALGPEGRVVTTTARGEVQVWTLDGKCEVLRKGTRAQIRGLAVSARGWVAVVLRGDLLVGRLDGGADWRSVATQLAGNILLAFSPDGSQLFCQDRQGAFIVGMDDYALTPVRAPACVDVEWVDERNLVTLGWPSEIHLLDLANHQQSVLDEPAFDFAGGYDEDDYWTVHYECGPLACSGDAQWLAVLRGTRVHLCHLPRREWFDLPVPGGNGLSGAVHFTPDGWLVHHDGFSQTLSVADPSRREWLGTVRFPGALFGGNWVFSDDGAFLMRLWNTDVQIWPWRDYWDCQAPKNPPGTAGLK